MYLTIHSAVNKITLARQADYLITRRDATKATIYRDIVCVVEIQSKRDRELCEMQNLTYMLLLMNTKGLPWILGILVYEDGTCRAYKAIRNGANCVYSTNDLFHLSHIDEVLQFLVDTLYDTPRVDVLVDDDIQADMFGKYDDDDKDDVISLSALDSIPDDHVK
jgi:hypothetical protein